MKSVDIKIYGAIGVDNSLWGDGSNNTANHVSEKLERLAKKFERINIHIHSPGGYISEGLAIINAINNSNADIHTYNDGFVGSMASIIFLSGKTHMPKTALTHFHKASSFIFGNADEMKKEAKSLEKFEDTIINVVAEKSGQDFDKIKEVFFNGDDIYLNVNECKGYNLIDEVIDKKTVKPKVENLNYSQVFNLYSMPAVNRKQEKPLNTFKYLFSNKKSEKMKFNKSPLLLGILAMAEFVFEDGFVQLDINQVLSIEEKLNEMESDKLDISNENEKLTAKTVELQNKIDELQNKLEAKPADPPVNPKTGDDKPDEEQGVEPELLTNLYQRNKMNLQF